MLDIIASTVYYNLNLRHPTLDMPIINYDLALLIQPMLMLGISIGVSFAGTSTKTCYGGVEIWKKETEAAKRLEDNDYKMLPRGHNNRTTMKPERALKEEARGTNFINFAARMGANGKDDIKLPLLQPSDAFVVDIKTVCCIEFSIIENHVFH
ncbi:hypothetical protein Tco_1270118 [Tanacetum coccineum]